MGRAGAVDMTGLGAVVSRGVEASGRNVRLFGSKVPKTSRTIRTIEGGGRLGRLLGGEEVLKVGGERGFESEGVAFEFEGKGGSVEGLAWEEEFCFQ